MNWSEEQKKVIGLKNKNILVFAAAGSGKTAVMVERIISMISDESGNTGLDELAVMTFTNAAADSMRMRIGRALRERIEAEPDNKRLRLQSAILPRASISTIHSFCQRLIKQHYQLLDIDPGFRLADEAESVMMRGDVLSALLEERYEENADAVRDEAFKRLVNTFEAKAFDTRLTGIINRVYDFIMGQPWPEDTVNGWLSECGKEALGEFDGSSWYREFEDSIRTDAKEQYRILERAAAICDDEDGPSKYSGEIESALNAADTISGLSGYEAMRGFVLSISFPTLPRIMKKDGVDEAKKAFVKDQRDGFKKWIKSLCDNEFLLSKEELVKQIKGSSELVGALLRLTLDFSSRYAELKREKNVLDFNDLEHKALEILYRRDDSGKMLPSAAADELALSYKEIMIDEYQDSNHVQEAIINALSAERFGRPDVFTVGDVKQSIYRFRNARPELFNRRYERYSDDGEADDVKIELNANYRSRSEVIDSVNAVFTRLMSKGIGGIEYDDRAMLKNGAVYPEGTDCKAELWYLDTRDDETAKESDEELKGEELEYRLIAERIKELVGEKSQAAFTVRDSESGKPRKACFKDITILIRKKKSAEPLIDILRKNGVPAYFDDSKGYFDAPEVAMMLSFLNIIDNPMQDIPLVTVMKGVIGDFSNNELAMIRAAYKETLPEDGHTEPGDFCRALKHYAEKGEDETIKKKAAGFMDMLSDYRDMADIVPVHILLNDIYIKTGYYAYASAMPLGDARRKNLDMLMKRAEDFGATGYQGLFNFVRYIEALKKYDTDYGEAPSASDGDIVNISTIHGSKGLEYPIVIIARAAESFEGRGSSENDIAIEYEGIGMDYTELDTSIVYPGLKKQFLKKKKKNEEIAEEQRLLYVAMTRAMEKLIITGASAGASEKLEKQRDFIRLYDKAGGYEAAYGSAEKIIPGIIKRNKSYLDWILLAGADNEEAFDIRLITMQDMRQSAADDELEKLEQYASIRSLATLKSDDTENDSSKELENKIDSIFNAKYPYEAETRLRPKISVSEIKEMAIEALESGGKIYDINADTIPETSVNAIDKTYTDKTVEEEKKSSFGAPEQDTPNMGALRGTAFHRAMELISYEGSREKQLAELMNSEKFAKEEKQILDKEAVLTYLDSKLAMRMKRAHQNKTLRREQHFMAGFPANTLRQEQNSGELQILQGIIDAYFEENGEIILVDYKTDKTNNPQELIDRYKTQLELYARALKQLTHKNVRESIIYSTFLKREIEIQ